MKLPSRKFQPSNPSPLSAGDIPAAHQLLLHPPVSNLVPTSPTTETAPSNLLEKLQTFPLFNNAPLLFHHKVASKLKLVQYTPQEYILKEGDPALSMYWILKGSVSVTSPDGDSVYAELSPGAFFGEIGILFNRPRTATVVARSRVLLGVLTADALNSVLRSYPTIERRIRDEAQERLSMQEKKNKADIPILKQSNSPAPESWNVPVLSLMDSNGLKSNPLPLSQIVTASRRGLTSTPLVASDNVDQTLSIQDYIKSVPIFSNLPPDLTHRLALGADPLNFKPYQFIFRKGDLGSDIYFVVDGEVEVIDHSANKDGAETTLARLKKGSYFGEMSFFELAQNGKTVRRSASIRTITSVELIVIRSHELERICDKHPHFVDEIRKTVLERKLMNENHTLTTQTVLPVAIPERRRSTALETITLRSLLSYSVTSSSRQLFSPEPSLFNPHWGGFSAFELSHNKPSRSVSPASSIDQELTPSKTPLTVFGESTDEPSRKRKSMCKSVSPLQQLPEGPLDINVPLQRSFDQVNSFPSSRRPSFQYMPHSKRIKLASLAGRRRSSVLVSPGSIPDKILLKVFEFLDLPELMRLRMVSRRWRQLLYAAPNIFQRLDLTPWNTTITDDALIAITDFVGSRPQYIDISNCFHITDEGFSYMVNEIGMAGNLKLIKMMSAWEVSAMAIMDLASPSVGSQLEEIDLSNCRKVNDDVVERLIGLSDETRRDNGITNYIPIGSRNIRVLSLSYCKALTDDIMHHIANNANETLESLSLARCTTITDAGFQYWTYRTFPKLKHLSLKDCTFLTDKAIISVANAAPQLESLNLGFCCALLDTAVEVLCLGCQNLRSLDLSFCGSAVSDSSLVAISLHLRNLKKLIVKGCIRVTRAGVDALLSGFSPLTHINISQCRNAHVYPGNMPAQTLQVNPTTKSAFITAGPTKDIIEIVI